MRSTSAWFIFTSLSFSAVWSGGSAYGQEDREPIVTDRPDFTESAVTVPQGMKQLEGGFTYTRNGEDKDYSLGELLLRIATGPKTEARIGINSYSWTRSPGGNLSGFGDASLGLKVVLSEGSGETGLNGPKMALIAATTLPTGSNDYREDALQPGAKLCLGWDLSETVAMSSNLNVDYVSDGGDRFTQFSGSLSFGTSLAEDWGAYLEYFGFFPEIEDGPNSHYLNGGVTYLVNPDYQFDVRVGVGLNGRSSDYFIGLGAARRW